MKDLLGLLAGEGAEELRLATGVPPAIVTRGKPHTVETPSLTPEELETLLKSISNEQQRNELEKCGDIHFVLIQNSTRFAVTATHSGGTLNIRIRNLDC